MKNLLLVYLPDLCLSISFIHTSLHTCIHLYCICVSQVCECMPVVVISTLFFHFNTIAVISVIMYACLKVHLHFQLEHQ